jgi:catechol 2,3-dioxygenase-like lactoylglutathione lyase family enzyme
MGVEGLELLLLEVNSLAESLDFYAGRLGLALSEHTPESEPPMATLRAGRLRVTLVEQPETMLRRGRGVHFFLSVADVDDFYERLRADDPHLRPPTDEGWGGRFITLEDPDHYRLFFVTWNDKEVTSDE